MSSESEKGKVTCGTYTTPRDQVKATYDATTSDVTIDWKSLGGTTWEPYIIHKNWGDSSTRFYFTINQGQGTWEEKPEYNLREIIDSIEELDLDGFETD